MKISSLTTPLLTRDGETIGEQVKITYADTMVAVNAGAVPFPGIGPVVYLTPYLPGPFRGSIPLTPSEAEAIAAMLIKAAKEAAP